MDTFLSPKCNLRFSPHLLLSPNGFQRKRVVFFLKKTGIKHCRFGKSKLDLRWKYFQQLQKFTTMIVGIPKEIKNNYIF